MWAILALSWRAFRLQMGGGQMMNALPRWWQVVWDLASLCRCVRMDLGCRFYPARCLLGFVLGCWWVWIVNLVSWIAQWL